MQGEIGGDVNGGAPTTVEDVDPTKQVEEELPQQSLEPPVRWSSKEHRPSERYSSYEYVMLTNAGEPETCEESIFVDGRND